MSVYTEVSPAALKAFLRAYDLGELLAFDGILDGVENSNYFVTTRRGRFVLTLFEATPRAGLPFFLGLMSFLAAQGIPAPRPIPGRDGRTLRRLCARPAVLVECLSGASVARPSLAQCAASGELIARMHLAVSRYSGHRESTRGPAWRGEVWARLTACVGPEDLVLLGEEMALQARDPLAGLPGGVVHGDLFHDNLLFDGAQLSGVIDFYYAADEAFVYDLAVAVAATCFTGGDCDTTRSAALLGAYRRVRSVSAAELAAWPTALRAAGLRFWLSRLHDVHFRKPGRMVLIKDPAACRAVVLAARRAPARLRACWG